MTSTAAASAGPENGIPGDRARVILDSARQAGWRSVGLHRVSNERTVERVDLPARTGQTIVLVTRGRAVVQARTGAGRWRRCDYGPGRIGMTAPGHPVTLRWRTESPEDKETLHLYLPAGLLTAAAEQLGGRAAAALPDTLGTQDRPVEAIMLAMADAAAEGADDLYAESAAGFLIVHLLTRRGELNRLGRLSARDLRLRRAVEFMHANLALPLSLADIAAAAELSPFHFARMFRAATGEPPHRYLTRLRVEAACRQLERTGTAITDIAYLCGFSSSAHLSAAVRRHVGMSPTRYRRERGTG